MLVPLTELTYIKSFKILMNYGQFWPVIFICFFFQTKSLTKINDFIVKSTATI